jgi:hypothetical protein
MEVERGGAPGPYIGKRKCGSRTIGIMMSSVGEGDCKWNAARMSKLKS